MTDETRARYQPAMGLDSPRFAGIATFMGLPHVQVDEADDVDIGLVGVPWDGGTTNRPGPRHGPRQMRDMSCMARRYHHVTRVSPYDNANIADLGDAPVNPVDVDDALSRIEGFYGKLVGKNIRPLTAGGDHLCTLPILRALGATEPVGMVHFDAHTDLFDSYFNGFKYTHGTPFRRAIEEELLEGPAADAIISSATVRNADLVVLGSRGSPSTRAFASAAKASRKGSYTARCT